MTKPTITTMIVDGKQITSVIMDGDEFIELVRLHEPSLAIAGANVDQIRADGVLACIFTPATEDIFTKYDLPRDRLVVLGARGVAERLAARTFGGISDSPDGEMTNFGGEALDELKKAQAESAKQATAIESETAGELAAEMWDKLTPNGVIVKDIRDVNLSMMWHYFRKALVKLHGERPITDEMIRQTKVAVSNIWIVNPPDVLVGWDGLDYLKRLLMMMVLTHRLHK